MKTSLMTHMIAGYPDYDTSLETARALVAGGASILEIQFPFSDPSADGPAIQAACTEALAAGFKVETEQDALAAEIAGVDTRAKALQERADAPRARLAGLIDGFAIYFDRDQPLDRHRPRRGGVAAEHSVRHELRVDEARVPKLHRRQAYALRRYAVGDYLG